MHTSMRSLKKIRVQYRREFIGLMRVILTRRSLIRCVGIQVGFNWRSNARAVWQRSTRDASDAIKCFDYRVTIENYQVHFSLKNRFSRFLIYVLLVLHPG